MSIKTYGADFEVTRFSAGEPHVKLTNVSSLDENEYLLVFWDFENIEEYMILALMCDIVKNNYPDARIHLFLSYVPFSRQDRYTSENQPFSLKVFSKMLGVLPLNTIDVDDIHSENGLETLKNHYSAKIYNKEMVDLLKIKFKELSNRFDLLIAPDKGAEEKVKEVGKFYNLPVVCATKIRNPETGELSNPEIDLSGYQDKDNLKLLVLDDICDYGGTFVQLGKEIKRQLPNCSLNLHVTHGIFAKGFVELKKYYDFISWNTDLVKNREGL